MQYTETMSPKIDIFSYGVLVLDEIVTKRRSCDSDDCKTDTVNLLSDVWTCWTKGTISQMIDEFTPRTPANPGAKMYPHWVSVPVCPSRP
uniref:Serine-threonine/tyrosine-protein kinase catalytic domain-containing protein n=1 Tax=Triticum urartu TaxID=4572 RepID=A0A8R7QKA4_TRIUA